MVRREGESPKEHKLDPTSNDKQGKMLALFYLESGA